MPTKSQIQAAEARIQLIRKELKKAGVDSLVVSHPASIRYLTGFSGSAGLLVVGMRSLNFFTNDLYEVQVSHELYKLDGMTVHITRDFWGGVKDRKLGGKIKSVGFVPAYTNVQWFKKMKSAFSPAKLVEVDDIVGAVTQVKTKHEIAQIAKAAEIASVAYNLLLSEIKPGLTEHEVATFLASKTRELGSERDAFDIIVVSGKRSAMPHGRATQAVIQHGSVVTVDFGCCINGLHSDMTRTFCVGTPSKKVVDVFAVLYDAHLSAIDAAIAGVTGAELDSVARTIIADSGYGNYFRHSLGHGLGYDVHEKPAVAPSNTTGVIQAGTVITIEPGIYLPGKFGMRIEDDVVVTNRGAEILTSAPRELVVV